MPTRDLAEKLQNSSDTAKKVVFNGIITQRLVDIASEVGIDTLIARKVGNIPKLPTSLDLISWEEIQ